MMDNFLIGIFAIIGFICTFAALVISVIKVYYFFENDFPQVKMKQSDIVREIDFLKQRIRKLEEKVND